MCLQISNINEAPVFLLLNPKLDHTRKDLPVALYETGVFKHIRAHAAHVIQAMYLQVQQACIERVISACLMHS